MIVVEFARHFAARLWTIDLLATYDAGVDVHH